MKKLVISGALLGSCLFGQMVSAAEYTVQSGDTLWKISTNHQVAVSEMKSLNKLTSDNIYPGQVLLVSEAKSSASQNYTVQPGDYLTLIAKKYQTTTATLVNLNPGLLNPNYLKIGQVILVPVTTTTNTNSANTTNTNTYSIQSGESLSSVAKKYGLSLTQLLTLNPQVSNPNVVQVGQVILVASGSTNSGTQSWDQIAIKVIESGKKYLGTPYQFGASPSQTATFDCSSFTQKVFIENGITLPRSSVQQSNFGKTIPVSEARKGDLLFFDTDFDGVINHVSIYVDSSTVLHAATTNGVSFSDTKYYWMPRFVKAVRVIN